MSEESASITWVRWVIILPIAVIAFLTVCLLTIPRDPLDRVPGIVPLDDSVTVTTTPGGYLLKRTTTYTEKSAVVVKALDKELLGKAWAHMLMWAGLKGYEYSYVSKRNPRDVIQVVDNSGNRTQVYETRHISIVEYYARIFRGQRPK